MFADTRRRERAASESVFTSLEVSTAPGSRRFLLMEGHWYELDATRLAAQHTQIARPFHRTPSFDLPAGSPMRANERP